MPHPSFTKATLAGAAVVAEIQATAVHLEQLMRNIHGGRWSIDISHEACFVSVARDFDAPRCEASEPIIAGVAAAAASRAAMLVARLDREVAATTETMEAIHGGEWRARINHDTCFITIAQKLEPSMKPKRRAV